MAAIPILLATSSAGAGPNENRQAADAAVGHLEGAGSQGADGSWGAAEALRPLVTSAVVDGLRRYNRRSPSYYRGVTWLENHEMANVDYHARRAASLFPHGDDVAADLDFLAASFSPLVTAGSGWGLAQPYAPSPIDSALALLAFAATGVGGHAAEVDAALAYLLATQNGDGSWGVLESGTGNVPVTATALRALAAYASQTPVTPEADAAAAYLSANVTGSSSDLDKAHASLALIAWQGTGAATTLIDALVASQQVDGSWSSDPYVTGLALQALAAKLGTDSVSYQAVVAIGDFGLRSAINLASGGNRGDAIRRGDLQNLTSLDANGFGIADLSGLEEATGLTYADLRNNDIADITPLLGLIPGATLLLQNTIWAGALCDLDDSGEVGANDSLRTIRFSTGELAPTGLREQTKADVAPPDGPGDGVVDVGDALLVTRAASGAVIAPCEN